MGCVCVGVFLNKKHAVTLFLTWFLHFLNGHFYFGKYA